jgi:CheY-like chemotaxis protein
MSEPERMPLILLVDDSEDDRFFFGLALKKSGIRARLVSVEDGEEAIEYLKQSGRFSDAAEFPRPDYLFLDLKMPRRNGFEVLAWIAQQSPQTTFPIIVLSGSHEPSDMRRAQEFGATEYLVKPITEQTLRRIIFP